MRGVLVLASLIGLSACAGPGPGTTDDPEPVSADRESVRRQESSVRSLERLERVEQPPGPEPGLSGEVPAELMERIRADAAGRLGVAPDGLSVDRAESVTWPDGSLGCPRAGEVYTQAPEPGYWVVLRAGERQLDYRARANGYFRLCEPRVPLPKGP